MRVNDLDAALFDLDGVLTDTATVHRRAWAEVLDVVLAERRPEQPPFSADDYRRHVDGRPRYDGVARFLASRGIEVPEGLPTDPAGTTTRCAIGNRKDAAFAEHLAAAGVDVFPGTVRLVRRLVAVGLRLGVVTASRHGAEVVAAAGLDGLFDVVLDGVVADARHLPGKPEPATFLAAAEALGCAPSRTAVFEDALAGVAAGRNGGFGCVIAVDRRGRPEELRAAGADDVVGDLAELRVVDAPDWVVELEDGAGGHRRFHDALASLSDGHVGVRGDIEHGNPSRPWLTLVNGAFGRGADGLVRLLPGPSASALTSDGAASADGCRRTLELRTGVLVHDEHGGSVASFRLVSLRRPGVVAVHAESSSPVAWTTTPVTAPELGPTAPLAATFRYVEEPDGPAWRARTEGDRGCIRVVARQEATDGSLDRLYGIAGSGELDGAVAAGFDRLLAEQRDAWAARWRQADIEIDGDRRSQQGVRFALFHLLGCAAPDGEAAVGARGLSGLAYSGHVFWDADVFVLPALVATSPRAARAMLEYRLRRLDRARATAAASGMAGARFPWESADDGEDVTPRSVVDHRGVVVPIRTGSHEVHIDAAIAWAADRYLDWTGDETFRDGHAALVTETARWWAARIQRDQDGSAHLRDVMGPDEYHEVVDDDVYTNGMARWNLRRAASLRPPGDAEAQRWRLLADALVDGRRQGRAGHEQFAGFDRLEPLRIADMTNVPVAADVLLGAARVAGAQVLKQPDVLMLHHMVPEELAPGSLAEDLDFYLPRTAHGSSLSPGICASLLARAGRPDEALALFDLATRLDLDDVTGATAAGLHLATLGSVWQAVVQGFAGIRGTGGRLRVDPCLPTAWTRLVVRLVWRGVPVRLTIEPDEVDVDADGDVQLEVHGVPIRGSGRVVAAEGRWRESR